METLINIFGYAATVCLICGYLPQAIYTMRTRNTEGIAYPTFIAMGLGSLFFTIQGILTGNVPLAIANAVTTISSAIITVIKVQNDSRTRRTNRQ